jgi:Domain of unknown function (DUF4249)
LSICWGICTFSLGFVGCEDVTSLTDLPYVERMVVSGVVEAGSTEIEITFSRTLGPSEVYSPEKALLTDVSGRIVVGSAEYTLTHVNGGVYRATGLSLPPGQQCELHANWNGMEVSATTVVPSPTEIDSAVVVPDAPTVGSTALIALVKGKAGECYGLTYELKNGSGTSSGGAFTTMSLGTSGSEPAVLEEVYPFSLGPSDTVYAVVHSYDGPLYEYFNSRGGNSIGHDDLLFPAATGYVNWNVQGDGIGMFIGHSVSRRVAARR